MKIKVVDMTYEQALAQPPQVHKKPKKPSLLFRTVLRAASAPDLLATHFHCEKIGMAQIKSDEPCLVLMNHSCFLDLKIAEAVLYPRPFNIVCTSDGFVGKEWPESIGKCVKALNVPVVMIRTYGAFARDPLYNGLQKRRTKVSAQMQCLLSSSDVAERNVAEINERIFSAFRFDNFRWQEENGVSVSEPFRADGLNRVLYKCPHCLAEGKMEGKGTSLICRSCNKEYRLTEIGTLECLNGEAAFTHVPDWYTWERQCVREELESGAYQLDIPVQICMMVNMREICRVGEGRLHHDENGFHLTGCGGKLDYFQKPEASYSLYADYFWYEIGDMLCIGDHKALYYCFPQGGGDVVAKTRLAAEELYKLKRAAKARG